MRDQPVEYKDISTRDLLENLVRGREGTRQETSSPYNIIYIYSCNPETSITDIYGAYEEGEAGGGGGGGGAVSNARRERRLVRTMEKGVPEAFRYVEALRVKLIRQGRENFNKVQQLMVPGLRHAPSRTTSTSRAAAASAAGTFFRFDPTQDAEEERFEGEEMLYIYIGRCHEFEGSFLRNKAQSIWHVVEVKGVNILIYLSISDLLSRRTSS